MFSINRIKKIALITGATITALALILTVVPFDQAVFAAQSTELEVIVQQQEGSTTATAQVYLHNPKGMASGQLEATYDASLFTVQDVTRGALMDQGNFTFHSNKSEPGIIKAGWFNHEKGITASGAIFEATFSVPGGQALEMDLQNIDLKKIDGTTVRIGQAEIKLQIGSAEAWVNDVAVSLDAPPFIRDSRTMVPVRFVSEQLGAEVNWLPETRQVQIVDGPKTIVLTIDSNRAMVDGQAQTLDASALIQNQRTYVPLRFVSETLGANVIWHPETQSITIN